MNDLIVTKRPPRSFQRKNNDLLRWCRPERWLCYLLRPTAEVGGPPVWSGCEASESALGVDDLAGDGRGIR
jgi:hypothetical protein